MVHPLSAHESYRFNLKKRGKSPNCAEAVQTVLVFRLSMNHLGVPIYKSVTDFPVTLGQLRDSNSMPKSVFTLSNFLHLRIFFQEKLFPLESTELIKNRVFLVQIMHSSISIV